MEDIAIVEEFLLSADRGNWSDTEERYKKPDLHYDEGYGGGDGYGKSFGNGEGYAFGYGKGELLGIKEFGRERVWIIDGVPTLIDRVHGNFACGRILNGDFTTTPCYIAKRGNILSHGSTLKEAIMQAESKPISELSFKERLKQFLEEFPTLDSSATCREFCRWHNILTGSCQMGAESYVKDNGLNMEGEYTVRFFLNTATHIVWGGDKIREVLKTYEAENGNTVI